MAAELLSSVNQPLTQCSLKLSLHLPVARLQHHLSFILTFQNCQGVRLPTVRSVLDKIVTTHFKVPCRLIKVFFINHKTEMIPRSLAGLLRLMATSSNLLYKRILRSSHLIFSMVRVCQTLPPYSRYQLLLQPQRATSRVLTKLC